MGNLPRWQLQAYQGKVTQLKTRLLSSRVPLCSRGIVTCPHPPGSLSGHRRESLVGGGLPVSITSASLPSRDSAGPLICGLLSSPDVLLCNVKDWRDPTEARANATCPGVTYDQGSRLATLRLGGQEFESKSPPSAYVPSEGIFLSSKVHRPSPESPPCTLRNFSF